MDNNYSNYLIQMTKKAGASEEKIKSTFESVGDKLPKDYLSLLRYSNGIEGRIGNQYLVIWSIEDIITLNDAYEVNEFAQGLLLFGSDGGGIGYAFDLRHQQPRIVEIPFIGMDLKLVKYLSENITGFFEILGKRSSD